jgi:hypothetical protein
LFRKITALLQHRRQDSRTEYLSVRRELHKSNILGRAAITESNAQKRKRWCHDHKTWTSNNRKGARDMFRRVILHAVPNIRKSLNSKNTQGGLQSRMTGSNSETRGRFCDGLGSNIVVQYCILLVPLLTFMAELLQESTWTGCVIRCIP